MKTLFTYPTRQGVASIRFNPEDGTHYAFLGEENLGPYGSPQLAAGDLAGGHTWPHPACPDTSVLGIPDDLAEWTRTS